MVINCVSIRSSARSDPATGRKTGPAILRLVQEFQSWRFEFFQQKIKAKMGRKMAEAASKGPSN